MDSRKEIELRSEKVRNIIGKIPPLILRIGIAVISLVIVLVLILAYFIPYPQYYNATFEMVTVPKYQIIRAPASGMYYVNPKEAPDLGIIISADSVYDIKSEKGGKTTNLYTDSTYLYQNEIIAVSIPDTIRSIFGICQIPASDIEKIKLST